MARKTKMNWLEKVAIGAGVTDGVILLNALNKGDSDIVSNPYVWGLAVITAIGAISTKYRENRVDRSYD